MAAVSSMWRTELFLCLFSCHWTCPWWLYRACIPSTFIPVCHSHAVRYQGLPAFVTLFDIIFAECFFYFICQMFSVSFFLYFMEQSLQTQIVIWRIWFYSSVWVIDGVRKGTLLNCSHAPGKVAPCRWTYLSPWMGYDVQHPQNSTWFQVL